MSDFLLIGLLTNFIAVAQLAFSTWIGHKRCPFTFFWALANCIFCIPASLGVMTTESPQILDLIVTGQIYYAIISLGIYASMLACELFAWKHYPQALDLKRYLNELNHIPARTISLVVAAVWISRFLALFWYGIFFSGTRSFSTLDGELSGAMALYISISTAAGYVIFYWGIRRILSATNRTTSILIFSWALCLSELAYTVITGRRWALMLIVIAFLSWWLIKRPQFRVLIFAIFSGLVVVYSIFIIFISLRIGTYQDQMSNKPNNIDSITQIFRKGIDALSSGESFENLNENLRERPSNIYYFIGSIVASHSPSMQGKALNSTIVWALPGNFFIDKNNYLQAEQLIQVNCGLVQIDTASSWAAYAYADFGIWGGLAYGAIIMLSLVMIYKFSDALHNPLLNSLIGAGIINCLFQIEQDVTGVFSIIRNMAIPITMTWIIMLFYKRTGVHPIKKMIVNKKRHSESRSTTRTTQ